jgi:hypothetical protein
MHEELVQYNSGDHVIGNKNVAEAVTIDGDIVFNESYVVIGEFLKARNIHATYDLDVMTDIVAEIISINGNLFVKGDIEADELICRGVFYCTGEIRVNKCNLGSRAMIGSVIGGELYAGGDLFIETTIDTDSSLEAEGLVVAGEGIMGDGLFKAKAAIANEYFEFSGKSKSKVFEISEMEFTEASASQNYGSSDVELAILDMEGAIKAFNTVFENSIREWTQFEEEEFIAEIRKVSDSMCDLHMIDRVVDTVISLSYERQIDNFRDYLLILCAKNTFPEGLIQYETLQPVIEDMLNEATYRLDRMEYKAKNIEELAISLFVLNKYCEQLPISLEEGADKIFSSIGIRYLTVEHIWREYNG